MSWQSYVDEHLMCEIEGHHLTSAAIIGHDGTVWAQSAAFPPVSVGSSLACSSCCPSCSGVDDHPVRSIYVCVIRRAYDAMIIFPTSSSQRR